MGKIITVTLKPSLDRTMITHYLNPGYHNRTTEPTRLDPAGYGVSISRGLNRMGVPTNAIILLGNDATSRAYKGLIEFENLPVTIVERDGVTHSHIIIVDTANKTETHIIEEASTGDEDDMIAITDVLKQQVQAGDTLVLAGEVTSETPADTYARFTKIAHDAGAQVVLVTNGEALSRGLKGQPELVVVRRREMESLFNYPIRTTDDIIFSARKLIEKGAKQVLVTVGADQGVPVAALVTPDGVWSARAPHAEVATYSGVIDALVAGFLAAIHRQLSFDEALSIAGAAATFTATQIGNEFGTEEDIRALLNMVQIVPV